MSTKNAKTAQPNVATFTAPKGAVVTGPMLQAWVNQHAGGQWASVQFVPNSKVLLANKYTAVGSKTKPLPFGYNGQPTGPRATFQNYYLYGMQLNAAGHNQHGTLINPSQKSAGVTTNLDLIHGAMQSRDGHSLTKLMCLCAMFNGGYGKTKSGIAYGTIAVNKV